MSISVGASIGTSMGGVAHAQEVDQVEALPPMATDRPGNGIAATTVPQFWWQVEASGNYAFVQTDSIETHVISFPTLLRFGVVNFLELRAGTGILGLDASGEHDVAATDTSVGTKLQVLSNEGWTPNLGFVVDVFLPSGTAPFTGDIVNPESRISASWALPDGFGLLLNAGLDIPEDEAGRFLRFVHVANVSYAPAALDGRLTFFVESFGRTPLTSRSPAVQQIDLGAAYLLARDFQLDVFTQHGLDEAAPDHQASLGLSTRF